jgi:Pilin (bacterial filament)
LLLGFFLVCADGLMGRSPAGEAVPGANQDDATGARIAEAFAAITPLRKSIEKAAIEKRPFPVGYISIASKNVQSVHVSPQGSIDIIFAPDLLGGGGRFLMSPFFDSPDKVKWSCLPGIPQKYVPAECWD